MSTSFIDRFDPTVAPKSRETLTTVRIILTANVFGTEDYYSPFH